MKTYLVDIVDPDPRYGYWDTWKFRAFTAEQAEMMAWVRLEQKQHVGSIIGEFRPTNVREA